MQPGRHAATNWSPAAPAADSEEASKDSKETTSAPAQSEAKARKHDARAAKWGKGLRVNESAREVRISMVKCGMTDEDMEPWCAWFADRVNTAFDGAGGVAREVNFAENKLTAWGVSQLFEMLRDSKIAVQVLKLYKNRIESGEGVAEHIRNCEGALKELHLSHNELDNDAVEEIIVATAACLKHGKTCYPHMPPGGGLPQPLWLRLEQNLLDCAALLESVPKAIEMVGVKRSGNMLCPAKGAGCMPRCCSRHQPSPPVVHVKFLWNQRFRREQTKAKQAEEEEWEEGEEEEDEEEEDDEEEEWDDDEWEEEWQSSQKWKGATWKPKDKQDGSTEQWNNDQWAGWEDQCWGQGASKWKAKAAGAADSGQKSSGVTPIGRPVASYSQTWPDWGTEKRGAQPEKDAKAKPTASATPVSGGKGTLTWKEKRDDGKKAEAEETAVADGKAAATGANASATGSAKAAAQSGSSWTKEKLLLVRHGLNAQHGGNKSYIKQEGGEEQCSSADLDEKSSDAVAEKAVRAAAASAALAAANRGAAVASVASSAKGAAASSGAGSRVAAAPPSAPSECAVPQPSSLLVSRLMGASASAASSSSVRGSSQISPFDATAYEAGASTSRPALSLAEATSRGAGSAKAKPMSKPQGTWVTPSQQNLAAKAGAGLPNSSLNFSQMPPSLLTPSVRQPPPFGGLQYMEVPASATSKQGKAAAKPIRGGKMPVQEFGQLVNCLREAPGKSLLLTQLREMAPMPLRRLAQDPVNFRASLRAIQGPVRVSGHNGAERVSLDFADGSNPAAKQPSGRAAAKAVAVTQQVTGAYHPYPPSPMHPRPDAAFASEVAAFRRDGLSYRPPEDPFAYDGRLTGQAADCGGGGGGEEATERDKTLDVLTSVRQLERILYGAGHQDEEPIATVVLQ